MSARHIFQSVWILITKAEFSVLSFPILMVTDEHRNRLLQSLEQFQSTVTNSAMPSYHSLTRFVNAFFDGFYPHFPLVHMPTFKLDDCEAEILLAMAALGAQYQHEHRKGIVLFYASKAILQGKVRERERRAIDRSISSESDSRHLANPKDDLPHNELMREARCALYLVAFGTWQREPEIEREAFNLQSFLARCIRESRLEEGEEIAQHNTTDWHGWVEQESHRRIKLFSFALMNLQSIAFNVPPVILSDEIHLRLPSSCIEWLVPCREKWSMVRSSGFREQMMLQDALAHMPRGSQESNFFDSQAPPSPLANYILLHALIQRILLIHRVFPNRRDGVEHPLLQCQKEEIR